MVYALVAISVLALLTIPLTVFLILNHSAELHEAMLDHLAETQVIGGQHVELAKKSQDFAIEDAREKRARQRPLPRPDDVVGN